MTAVLHALDDGGIDTLYGRVGAIEPCVLISGWVVEATRGAARPLCGFARDLLGPGGYARTDGEIMTVVGRERTLTYRLEPAEWSDGHGRVTTDALYLGVLI